MLTTSWRKIRLVSLWMKLVLEYGILKLYLGDGRTSMDDKELIGKVHSAMYHQCQKRGYAAPVDVLMDIGALPKQKYEEWRYGHVPYLEAVCIVNLHKLSRIMHEMRVYAQKNNLKRSFCYYKQWAVKKPTGQGHKPVIPLRFSKSGKSEIEKWYATHFVDATRIANMKEKVDDE